jgi:ketosteroid isomerase-like protein
MNTLKKIAISLALVLLASALALGQTKRDSALETELIEMEKRGFEAWKNKDVKFYQETTTEAAYSVDRFGVLPHEQFLKAIGNHPCKVNSYNLDNFKVTRLNPDTALLTYRYTQDVVCLGKPEPSPIWASTLFSKRGGKWLAAFHQETPATTSFPTAAAEPVAQIEEEVKKISQAYDQAWLRQDAAAFERLLADDAILVDENGRLTTKAEVIANAKSGAVKFEVGKSEDVKRYFYGNTVVTTGRWTEKSTNNGRQVNSTMQNTTVYAKRNGNWQVVADQVTLIAPPSTTAQAEQEVRQATQEYDRAYQQQDAAALDRILADDYRLVEYRGNILSKAEMLAQAKAGTVKVETGHSEAVQVRVYGDVTLATGRFIEKSTKDGQPYIAGTMQFTTMFLKQNGHWRVLADQVTLIAPAER